MQACCPQRLQMSVSPFVSLAERRPVPQSMLSLQAPESVFRSDAESALLSAAHLTQSVCRPSLLHRRLATAMFRFAFGNRLLLPKRFRR